MDSGNSASRRPDGTPLHAVRERRVGQQARPPNGSIDIMRRVQRLREQDKDLPKELKAVIKARCGGDKKAVDALFISLLLETFQGDAKAAKELLDRGCGKVADKIEGGDTPIEHTFTLKIDNG